MNKKQAGNGQRSSEKGEDCTRSQIHNGLILEEEEEEEEKKKKKTLHYLRLFTDELTSGLLVKDVVYTFKSPCLVKYVIFSTQNIYVGSFVQYLLLRGWNRKQKVFAVRKIHQQDV